MFACIVYAQRSKTGPYDWVLEIAETKEGATSRYKELMQMHYTLRPWDSTTPIVVAEVYGPSKHELRAHQVR